jgi:hypothetical protein
MLVIMPLNAFIAKLYNASQAKKLKFSDTRIKIINEVLSGIKVIKLYGWGESNLKYKETLQFLKYFFFS